MKQEPSTPFDAGAALVVGGSGGLGQAICRAFAEAGCPVALTWHRRREAAEQLVRELTEAGGQAWHWSLDLTDYAQVEARLGEIHAAVGRIHSVVYAAGPKIIIDYLGRLAPADVATVVTDDVLGFFHLSRAALPLLKQQGGGSVTALTTTQASHVEPRGVLSAAPKAAIETMIRAMAREEAAHGIRANAVRAGWANVGLGADALAERLSDKARQMILSTIPMGRFGDPMEIAEAVVFLASRRASFITGTALAADGGQHL